MNTTLLSHEQRQHRMNIRNFLMTAQLPELERELEMARENIRKHPSDAFKELCVIELIDEAKAEMAA